MNARNMVAIAVVSTAIFSLGCTGHVDAQPQGQSLSAPSTDSTSTLPVIPTGKDSDIKFYPAQGVALHGQQAFEQMPKANLILWLAGNQFFAMDDIIGTFQKSNSGTSVGLITLPPGLLLQAIEDDGWVFDGKEYRGRPDIYASVNIGHLKELKKLGMMDRYMVYMHNELQIMVAKENPKRIIGVDDLVRDDVRTSMPNPVNEGIMQFYIRNVLERHGLWQRISGGKECVSCQTTSNNWFTAVHHRETPARIQSNQSDAGVVWKTEVIAALRAGAAIDAVELPPQDSLREQVSYVIGPLRDASHAAAGRSFLDFLRSSAGQELYAKYGFVKATNDQLMMKPIE